MSNLEDLVGSLVTQFLIVFWSAFLILRSIVCLRYKRLSYRR